MKQNVKDNLSVMNTLFFAITDVPDDEWHKVHVEIPRNEPLVGFGDGPFAGFIQPMWPAGYDLETGEWRDAIPAWEGYKPAIWGAQSNGVVNLGLQMALDKLSGVTAPANLADIGIASDTSAVTATTVFLGGAAAAILSGGTQNGFIRAFSPAATRSNQVLTAGATFTQADQSGALFVIHKVGLLNAATDVGTGLGAGPASGIFDVIGGTGGSAPFNQPFTIDLTGVTSWSLLMQIQVTAANS